MSGKSIATWEQTKQWCVAHPGKRAAIASMEGSFVMTWEPHTPKPSACDVTYYDQTAPLGDCLSCDGYVLTAADAPYCPSCARERKAAANG